LESANLYKKTEVGVIPENWEVRKLGEILKIKHGKSQHHVVVEDGQYPILATGGEIGRANKYLFDKPSVLIGRKGTIDRPQYIETPFWTIDTLFYTEISKKCVAKYIYYLFNRIDWYSYNEASGVPSLNTSTIENINIPLPPLPEQKAIAKVLSDIDELVASIEKLIDKKQKIKQGTMQLLLTGKKRLPGFTGEWEVRKLGDIADVATGSTPYTKDLTNYGNEYLFVSPADLGRNKYIHHNLYHHLFVP
jgi:type I restriction enzyme S subunit